MLLRDRKIRPCTSRTSQTTPKKILQHPRIAAGRKKKKKRKVVNDLLHPCNPRSRIDLSLLLLLRTSLHSEQPSEQNKQTSVKRDMLQDFGASTILYLHSLCLPTIIPSSWRFDLREEGGKRKIACSFAWFWRMTRWKEESDSRGENSWVLCWCWLVWSISWEMWSVIK